MSEDDLEFDDLDDMPSIVRRLPPQVQTWAVQEHELHRRQQMRHNQLRKEHDQMVTDVKEVRVAVLGGGDGKQKGVVQTVDNVFFTVKILAALVALLCSLIGLFVALHKLDAAPPPPTAQEMAREVAREIAKQQQK